MAAQETSRRKRGEDVNITPAPENNCLAIGFGDGTQAVLNLGDLSQEIITLALYHGLKNKLIPALPAGSTAEAKKANVLDTLDTLLSGNWTKPRETAAKVDSSDLLYTAMVRICDGNHSPYPRKSPEAIKEYLDKYAKAGADTPAEAKAKKDTLRQWASKDAIAREIAEIKAERGKGQPPENVSDLLDDLMRS
jgi:hypothetical protein